MNETVLPEPAVEFLETQEYRRFAEFCDACRRYRYIGLCHGPPGVGKTLSARYYARWDTVEPALATQRGYGEMPGIPEAVHWRVLRYTPRVTTTPVQIDRELFDLRRRLKLAITRTQYPDAPHALLAASDMPDPVDLLVVDEADRLEFPTMEQLRDIYDRVGFGLVLIGMPGLEKRLARYPQLYSRIGFVHAYRPLNEDAMHWVLAHKWTALGIPLDSKQLPDAEAMAAISRITGGNFRLVQRLFSQIERILEINGLHAITADVVEAARHSLVIGTS